jgi:hypothetical protein
MLTYDRIEVTVRRDNVTSLIFRMDTGYDGFSFYAETTKLCAFLRGGKDAPDVLRDVFRVALRFMERITFCDLGRAMEKGEARPKLELECYNMTLPIEVGRLLAAQIEGAAQSIGDRHEVRWEISREDRAHWLGMYGIGKGSVRIEFSSDEVKNKFEAYLADYRAVEGWDGEGEEPAAVKAKRTFERSLESLKAIAKNTTTKTTDVGILRIGPDWAGFTFSAGGLFGGLIFHEASGEWSVHT